MGRGATARNPGIVVLVGLAVGITLSPVPPKAHAVTSNGGWVARAGGNGPVPGDRQEGEGDRESQEAILQVKVNTLERGEYFVELTGDGDVLMDVEDFRRLQIGQLEEVVEAAPDGTVSLRSLSEYLSFSVDPVDLVLRIDVEPAYLGETVVEVYSPSGEGEGVYRSDDSAFLNYGATYLAEEGFADDLFRFSGEVGARIADVLGTTTFAYEGGAVDRVVRLRTRFVKDFRDSLRRLTVGDFDGVSGPLGSTLPLGGFSLSKNFDIDPFFLTFPTFDFAGSVATPAQIEVLRNGDLVRREHLPPGRFVLEDLPPSLLGTNEFQIRIRDAFGRERIVRRPYYFDNRVLRPGVQRYSYNLGFVRRGLGRDSFDYGELVFQAFHEFGLSREFDVGVSGELADDLANVGAGAAVLLGGLGLLEGDVAFSRAGGRGGAALSVAHSRFGRILSSTVSVQAFSDDFADLSILQPGQRPHLSGDVRLQLALGDVGSLSGGYTYRESRDQRSQRRIFLNFNRPVWRRGNLFVSLSTSENRTAEGGVDHVDEAFVGFHLFLGKGVSGSVTHTVRDGDVRQSLRLQKNPPQYDGIGYRVSVDNDFSGAATQGDGSFQYNGSRGIYRADVRRFGDVTSGSLSASGGIVLLGRSLHLTRPVNDSFALVRVPDLEGVEVSFNNHVVGRTDEDGDLLVPNLLPYHPNQIELDGEDLPIDYSLETLSQRIVSPWKGGAIVDFPTRRVQGIFGTLLAAKDGVPLEFAALELQTEESDLTSQTGRDGEFYLENLPAGTHTAIVTFRGRTYACRVTVPESDEILVDLGEVGCRASE